MGKSNPNGRGYASARNSQIVNQFTAGGNAKAGTGLHLGMGQFVNGPISNRAPTVSGLAWFSVFRTQYPVPNVNQIGGVGMPRWGMTRAPADGVNVNALNAGRARVAAGPRTWGLVV